MTAREARKQWILVADEDRLVRWALGERLRDAGFRVVEASTAGETLRRSGSADLVLLGTIPPGRDPLDLPAEIRRCYPDLLLIVTSTEGTTGTHGGAGSSRPLSWLARRLDLDRAVALACEAIAEHGRR